MSWRLASVDKQGEGTFQAEKAKPQKTNNKLSWPTDLTQENQEVSMCRCEPQESTCEIGPSRGLSAYRLSIDRSKRGREKEGEKRKGNKASHFMPASKFPLVWGLVLARRSLPAIPSGRNRIFKLSLRCVYMMYCLASCSWTEPTDGCFASNPTLYQATLCTIMNLQVLEEPPLAGIPCGSGSSYQTLTYFN